MFDGEVMEAASEPRRNEGAGIVTSAEDRLDDTREKLGRRMLPFMETAIFAKVVALKKSGTMVAISGLRGGMLPVMIHSPVSATDQL